MRIKSHDGKVDVEAIKPTEARMRDVAALQRETGWKLDKVEEMGSLEGPGLAITIYFSYRSIGQMISFSRAEELLDEVEFEPTEAEMAEAEGRSGEAEGPTSAPTGSDRGEGRHAADADETDSQQ